MILLIRNLLDTPLHVYKPLEPHQIGINQFVILLFAHRNSALARAFWMSWDGRWHGYNNTTIYDYGSKR
jgi:hypothetical protein